VPTRFLINGRAADWDEGNASRLRLGQLEPVCEAVLLSSKDAGDRAVKRIRQFYAVFGGGLAVVFLVLVVVGHGRPGLGFFPTLLGIAAFVVVVVAALLYPIKISGARARITAVLLPAPPSSTMRADQDGLRVEGRGLLPWSALVIATADMLRVPVRDGSAYYLVRSLVLAMVDGDDAIVLDPIVFTNARAFLDNVFQRLQPGRFT
jgi:hypothetical protein